MKVVSVVGARPQFVKLAPIAEAFAEAGVEHMIIHTGQHYDAAMSDVFFKDLRIPSPDIHLGVGSGPHGAQTGAMLAGIEPALMQTQPDWVLVYGDTNSTLAAAIAAVKLHLPLAHLEAGLRSFNRQMPEEHNRVLTDHASDLLLAPTPVAAGHLASEGLAAKTVVVGDVMADVCLRVAAAVAEDELTEVVPGVTPKGYLMATLHRAENTDDPARLAGLIEAMKALPMPVVLAVHPRLRDRAAAAGISLTGGSLIPIEPLPYPGMVLLVSRAHAVLTDSGGLQKEAYLLGVPCTTLRAETEWVETLTAGWNVLAPGTVDLAQQACRQPPAGPREAHYGHGDAAAAVLAALVAGSPAA